jgi:hypothetical protein
MGSEVAWAVGSSPHRAAIVRGVFYNLWVSLRFVIFAKKGFVPDKKYIV